MQLDGKMPVALDHRPGGSRVKRGQAPYLSLDDIEESETERPGVDLEGVAYGACEVRNDDDDEDDDEDKEVDEEAPPLAIDILLRNSLAFP
eukprot:g12218.t1